jgi:hypothetical protein
VAGGSKGGRISSVDVVRAVTAVPLHGQRRKKVVVGFQGLRLKPGSNRLACLVLTRGSLPTVRRLAVLISVSRRGERPRVLHIEGAQRRLDVVAKAGDAFFDGWT